jgi:transposase-like protein
MLIRFVAKSDRLIYFQGMEMRGFPASLPEFQRVFPDDAACAAYLEHLRWPAGFVCAHCGHQEEPYRFPSRSSVVLRCRACKKNTSLTVGTVMRSSHTPLSTWFWAAYLLTTQTPGMSAARRQLGWPVQRQL